MVLGLLPSPQHRRPGVSLHFDPEGWAIGPWAGKDGLVAGRAVFGRGGDSPLPWPRWPYRKGGLDGGPCLLPTRQIQNQFHQAVGWHFPIPQGLTFRRRFGSRRGMLPGSLHLPACRFGQPESALRDRFQGHQSGGAQGQTSWHAQEKPGPKGQSFYHRLPSSLVPIAIRKRGGAQSGEGRKALRPDAPLLLL